MSVGDFLQKSGWSAGNNYEQSGNLNEQSGNLNEQSGNPERCPESESMREPEYPGSALESEYPESVYPFPKPTEARTKSSGSRN